ncbi:MAG: tetratricopeptide repeat protein [Polyangiales bacterium]
MTTSSRRLRAVAFGAALSLAVPFAPRIALADPTPTGEDMATARKLYNQGRELRDKGNIEGALEKFKQAHALAATPITGYELGKTHMQLGQLVQAREAFLSVARVAVTKDESKNSAKAREESEKLAEELRTRIPTVRVTLKSLATGAVASVSIDGTTLPQNAIAVPYAVNPGKHEIVVTVVDAEGSATEHVEVKEGEARDVEVNVVALVPVKKVAPKPVVATPPAPEPKKSVSTLTYVGFSVAGVGIIAGTVTGIMSLSKASTVKDQCDGTRCPRTVQSDLDSSKSLGTISTIAFGVGIAGLAVGVIGLFTSGSSSEPAPKAASKPFVSPYVGGLSAGIHGAF